MDIAATCITIIRFCNCIRQRQVACYLVPLLFEELSVCLRNKVRVTPHAASTRRSKLFCSWHQLSCSLNIAQSAKEMRQGHCTASKQDLWTPDTSIESVPDAQSGSGSEFVEARLATSTLQLLWRTDVGESPVGVYPQNMHCPARP